jgi:hypothetical protein
VLAPKNGKKHEARTKWYLDQRQYEAQTWVKVTKMKHLPRWSKWTFRSYNHSQKWLIWSCDKAKLTWSIIGTAADPAPIRPVSPTGQTNVLKMLAGFHPCIDPVETVKMNMWNFQFRVCIRELWSWQEPALRQIGLTGRLGRFDWSRQPNPS